jgi:hypothetical protein
MMEALGTLVVVLVTAAVSGAADATWGLRGPEIIGAGFTGYRGDGWPIGVQERDDPWGWRTPEPEPTVDEHDWTSDAVIVEIQPIHPNGGRSPRGGSARR